MNASKKVFSIFENKTMEQTATKKKALFKSSQIASYLLDNSSSDESKASLLLLLLARTEVIIFPLEKTLFKKQDK